MQDMKLCQIQNVAVKKDGAFYSGHSKCQHDKKFSNFFTAGKNIFLLLLLSCRLLTIIHRCQTTYVKQTTPVHYEVLLVASKITTERY